MQQSGTRIGCTSQKVFVSELMLRVGPLKNSPAVTQERTQVEYVQAKLPWSKTLLLSPSSASRQLCCLAFLDVGWQVTDRQLTRKLPHLTDQTSAACLASSSTPDSPHILQDLLRAVVRTSRSSSAVWVMRVPHAHADWLAAAALVLPNTGVKQGSRSHGSFARHFQASSAPEVQEASAPGAKEAQVAEAQLSLPIEDPWICRTVQNTISEEASTSDR